MRLMIIGAGGVGSSVAKIIQRHYDRTSQWLEIVVIANRHIEKAQKVVDECGGSLFEAAYIDANKTETIEDAITRHKIDYVLNTCDPRANENIFDTCLKMKVGYMDCAMTLGTEHPEKPYELSNIKLGDYQFAKAELFKEAKVMAVVGAGIDPGIADVFAKYADVHLFDEIDEINVRDGDNFTGTDSDFGFSVWTTIEESLQPPVIWEKTEEYPDGHWYCTDNFSEPEIFHFPEGIGDIEVVNVEHEEVLLVPREIDCRRCTFKYGLPKEFRERLLTLKAYGLSDKKRKIRVGEEEISPRDFICKVIPAPDDTTLEMEGRICVGTWVKGKKDGKDKSVFIYQITDNQESVSKYGTNAVVAQTAVSPVIMLELIAAGIWNEPGVFGPEHFDPDPFIERMEIYEAPYGIVDM